MGGGITYNSLLGGTYTKYVKIYEQLKLGPFDLPDSANLDAHAAQKIIEFEENGFRLSNGRFVHEIDSFDEDCEYTVESFIQYFIDNKIPVWQ